MNTNKQSTVPSKRPRPSSPSESEEEGKGAAGKQPVLQGASSKTGGQGPEVEQDSNSEQDKYTRPPRVSFGVELEFLVFCRTNGVDDESATGLPPLQNSDRPAREMVARLLKEHGLNACSIESEDDIPDPPGWVVRRDDSVAEYGAPGWDATNWDNVEVNSPPLYACDEAFRLLAAVIRLITTNFRVRVNQACGLHVHVANGPHHLDMRAMRNYAALIWATDSVLSTLHCPGRAAVKYSNSNRRIAYTDLSRGRDAQDAYNIVADKELSWIPRYLGRARKLGEAPVVSRQKLRQRIKYQEEKVNHDGFTALDPECPSDHSDWEMPGSKPFFRPKKPDSDARRRTRRLPNREFLLSEEDEARLDGESITRELPPQVDFDLVGLYPPPSPPYGSIPKSFLEENRPRQKQLDIEKITEDPNIVDRYDEPTIYRAAESWRLTWPGVKELLSCDVGVHQVALLMSKNECSNRYASSNWSTNTPEGMTPGERRARGGRRTIECRLAHGSMDAEWVVTWTKIQCRLLEWARDADPSAFMEVLCKLARDDHSDECTYDVLDLLRDLGMYTEVEICRKRLERAEEAWYECMLFKEGAGSSVMTSSNETSSNNSEGGNNNDGVNTNGDTSSSAGNQDSEDIYDAN